METREAENTTTAPPLQQEKEQVGSSGTGTTHDDTIDPTQAIANVPRFLGERQPLPDELQLLEDFQRLLDETHVELPRRYVCVSRRFYLVALSSKSAPIFVLCRFVNVDAFAQEGYYLYSVVFHHRCACKVRACALHFLVLLVWRAWPM
jgi:hypothetical protein